MKILGCTSIRSDYDLLSPLYQLLDQDDSIDFRLAVSGAHLSEDYGRTIEQIENDKFKILCKIQTLISETDDKVDRIKSASLLLTELIGHIQDFAPDLVIYAGDRKGS